ncbi:MAG: hypothetical protein L3J52_02510 [Proteobacteria bacterium]|nr:hypothetical protein [Pseudomonadota bacterium]
MKFIFKTLIGFIVIIAVIITSVFIMTGGMPDVADEYLESVKSQDHEKANSFLSSYIKNESQSLLQYVQDNSMDNVKSTSWSNRAFVNNNGSIAGKITTNNNETINARMTFVKEDGDWKIYSIQKQTRETANEVEKPANAHQVELAHEAMKIFMLSASEGNMSKFHKYLSAMWQSQTSIDALNQAFKAALQFNGDFTFLDQVKPVVEFNSIIDNDILMLSGSFTTDWTVIYFSQKYLYEATTWKLIGFEYNNKKPSE